MANGNAEPKTKLMPWQNLRVLTVAREALVYLTANGVMPRHEQIAVGPSATENQLRSERPLTL